MKKPKQVRAAKDADPDNEITWLPPVQQDDVLSTCHTWWIECKRYCVRRTAKYGFKPWFGVGIQKIDVQHGGGLHRWLDCLTDGSGSNYPKRFRSLEQAIAAAEEHYCTKFRKVNLVSNAREVIAAAKELAGSPLVEQKEKPPHQRAVATQREVDGFGSRKGSQAAAINAVMTTVARPVGEIAEQAGIVNVNRVMGHIRWLMERGFAEKEGSKFRLKR